MTIDQFLKQLLTEDPDLTPEKALHRMHEAGYTQEEAVLCVKEYFDDIKADEMCRIVVNEYYDPLIEKAELRRLLLLCGYNEAEVVESIATYYPQKLGYVLMLDDSVSMQSASAMIKIDAKAFIRKSRIDDQFGINSFKEDAKWLSPEGSAPDPATVTSDRSELKAAEAAIDKLQTQGNWTNIGAAIVLGNEMIGKMTTDIQAYVLISDGENNTGVNPAKVLQDNPPIYIAGLGPYLRKESFQAMLDKNDKSTYYSSPNAEDMATVFNEILAASTNAVLALNDLNTCKGVDYLTKEFYIAGHGNNTLLSVVWPEQKYRYTKGYPSGNNINLILIDPTGKNTDIQPDVSEGGFCIYDLRNAKPGKWKLLMQFDLQEPIKVTSGASQSDTGINIRTRGSHFGNIGEATDFSVVVETNNAEMGEIKVEAKVDTFVSGKGADGWIVGGELPLQLKRNVDGTFCGRVVITDQVAGCWVKFVVTGRNQRTGIPFRYVKTHSICAESK